MKRLAPLVLVACSAGSAPDAGLSQTATAAPGKPPLTAAHASQIRLLAVTDDGGAVVSQDDSGGTRLWPALDGSREPSVVHAVSAVQLAIGRDDDGFVIAALDTVGGLELIRVDPFGVLRSRVHVAPEPAIEELQITPSGVLALRADQTIAVIDVHGTIVNRLEPPTGARITAIHTRGGRALAILESTDVRARWIEGAQWGAETLSFDIGHAAVAVRATLSIDGKWLAIGRALDVALIDLKTGKLDKLVQTRDADVGRHAAIVPIGFVDASTIATLESNQVALWSLDGTRRGEKDESVVGANAFALGDGVVVGSWYAQLELHAATGNQFLGYRTSVANRMRLDSTSIMLGNGSQNPLVLDRAFTAQRELSLPDDPRELVDVVAVDDHMVLAMHTLNGRPSLSVIDTRTNTTHQAMMTAPYQAVLKYERSSQLLEITDHEASYLVRFDPTEQRFSTWYRLAGPPGQVFLVDPARADGVVAIVVHQRYPKAAITAIHATDLRVGAPVEGKNEYELTGGVSDVDRAGRVYHVDGEDMVVYKAGIVVGRFAGVGWGKVAVSADGSQIAMAANHRLRLFNANGTLRWETAAPLASAAHWLGNELIAQYAGGLVKHDVATGDILQRTCGWQFGLFKVAPIDTGLSGESICDQS